MKMIVITFLVAAVVLLCFLTVLAMRRQWQKALLALLGIGILLLLIVLLMQSYAAVQRLAIMQNQSRTIEDLKAQIEELKKRPSNEASQAVAPQGKTQPER